MDYNAIMDAFLSYPVTLFLAGFIYLITPGPVFISILSLVSSRGRITGTKLVFGAFFGCIMWLAFSIFSLIAADRLPELPFLILAFISALYLFYLGTRMMIKSVHIDQAVFSAPFRDGFFLALFNPKSYPVFIAVLGSVMSQYENLFSPEFFIPIFIYTLCGIIAGYAFMIFVSGFSFLRSFFIKYVRQISVLFGLIFYYFGASLLWGVFGW